MDGSANQKKQQRTLASQPAAAAHVGATAAGALDAMTGHGADELAMSAAGAARRSRLQRMLLAARQMQSSERWDR